MERRETGDRLGRLAVNAEALVMMIQLPAPTAADRQSIEDQLCDDVHALLTAAHFGRDGALNFSEHELCLESLLSMRSLLTRGIALTTEELLWLSFHAELAEAEYKRGGSNG